MTSDGGFQIREATPKADDDSIVGLHLEYLTWVFARLTLEYGLEKQSIDEGEVREALAKFRRPGGAAFLVEADREPVGVVGMWTMGDEVLEIKRMYVRPAWRGAHIGSTLLDRVLHEASLMGAKKVSLDTVRFMNDAQRVYRSRGFVERAPYEGTEIPPDVQMHWLFFEKDLAADSNR